jgi:hypothetical protein
VPLLYSNPTSYCDGSNGILWTFAENRCTLRRMDISSYKVGQKVKLAEQIGNIPIGTVGVISHIEKRMLSVVIGDIRLRIEHADSVETV